MLDVIKLRCDRVHLASNALNPKTVPDGFGRSHYQGAANRSGRISLAHSLDDIELLRAACFKLDDGRWLVKRVRCNLPKLLHGHNGRVLENEAEAALALTRLRWILKPVVLDADWGRIVPGVGGDNSGYIDYLETTAQVNDPGGRLIRASHIARLPYQRFPSCVYYGESTRASQREIAVAVYDKLAEAKFSMPVPGHSPTRVEVILRHGERLAKEVALARRTSLAPGCQVATLSFDDAYRVHQNIVRTMTGFRWSVDPADLRTLNSSALLMVIGLGDALGDPFRVDDTLQAYRRVVGPTDRHFRTISKQVREIAGRLVAPDIEDQLPANRSDLETVNVVNPAIEDRFACHMSSIGAPMEPDEDILGAWSSTAFVGPPGRPGGLVGTTAPGTLPFLRDSL